MRRSGLPPTTRGTGLVFLSRIGRCKGRLSYLLYRLQVLKPGTCWLSRRSLPLVTGVFLPSFAARGLDTFFGLAFSGDGFAFQAVQPSFPLRLSLSDLDRFFHAADAPTQRRSPVFHHPKTWPDTLPRPVLSFFFVCPLLFFVCRTTMV